MVTSWPLDRLIPTVIHENQNVWTVFQIFPLRIFLNFPPKDQKQKPYMATHIKETYLTISELQIDSGQMMDLEASLLEYYDNWEASLIIFAAIKLINWVELTFPLN